MTMRGEWAEQHRPWDTHGPVQKGHVAGVTETVLEESNWETRLKDRIPAAGGSQRAKQPGHITDQAAAGCPLLPRESTDYYFVPGTGVSPRPP